MAYYPVASLPDTNARQPAVTIRQSSTALLTIDSEDRYNSYIQSRNITSTPYNFSITKTESLMPGFITRLGVSEVVFPWAIPNVNLKSQTIAVSYFLNGAAAEFFSFDIPIGFYTPSQLATIMQSSIRTALLVSSPLVGQSFTMTYGSSVDGSANNVPMFKYATNVVGETIAFFPETPNTPAYPYSAQSKQLFDLLGFTTINNAPLAAGSGIYTYCQATRYIDIVSSQLTNSQAQKDQTSQTVARDMLCRIYLGDGGPGGQSTVQPSSSTFSPPGCAPTVLYRNFTNPKQIQWIPNQNIPGFLQFQVYDDTGDLLDNMVSLPVGGSATGYVVGGSLDWSMTLLVSEC